MKTAAPDAQTIARMTAILVDRAPRLTSSRIVDLCTDYARGSRYQNIRMIDLCEVTGASERRVRDAFYERCGTAPMVHLRVTALIEVRRHLLDGPTVRDAVTRTATDYGFFHLSRFAAQYRALFGESPSETVSRARVATLASG